MSDAVFPAGPRSLFRGWPPVATQVLRAPGSRSPRLPLRTAAAMATLALALMLLAVAANALLRLHESKVAPPAPPPPLPEWIDVPRPVHIYDLAAPMFRGLPLLYSARRRTAGDGREDVLAYGTPGQDATALRLRLERRAAGSAAPPLVAAIASQAADAGLSIGRAGLADLMPTRFGSFEIVDLTLTDGAALRLPCSGFRLALPAPAFTMSGLACGAAAGKPMDRATLACLVDRLDLASGGEDRAMIDFFAASERRRDLSCAGARLAPDALHAAWLDDKPVTHAKTLRRH